MPLAAWLCLRNACFCEAQVSFEAQMSEETQRLMHKTIKKVTLDNEVMSFNTAIAQLMIFSSHLAGERRALDCHVDLGAICDKDELMWHS